MKNYDNIMIIFQFHRLASLLFKCDDGADDRDEPRLNEVSLGESGNGERSLVDTDTSSDMTSTTDDGK